MILRKLVVHIQALQQAQARMGRRFRPHSSSPWK
jgi:hypothetical protein